MVKAARAGDQGCGFPVVASEVRALAQRSAKAAHEIRDIIAQSSHPISDGTTQMHCVSRTVHCVAQSVLEMCTLIYQFDRPTHPSPDHFSGD